MGAPKIQDPSIAAVTGMVADANNFPQSYLINAAAQQGRKITIGGKTYDFTGLGNADQAAAQTQATDQAALDIQRQYGPEYIQQALANLERSNPTGVAARRQLSQRILADSQDQSASPLAIEQQRQVQDMLAHAGELDPQAKQQVQQSTRGGQVARGITQGNAPASEEASAMVNASDNLRSKQQTAAQNYLSSGVSPEDVQYRKIQQSLSNLGAFVNGQTPQAQFGQLSGAQQGAAPNQAPNYSNPASLDPNAGSYGIQFSNQAYNINNQNANPWLTGLSTAANGANSVFNSLYQPQNYGNNEAAFNAVGNGWGGTMGQGGTSGAGVGVGFGGNPSTGVGVG